MMFFSRVAVAGGTLAAVAAIPAAAEAAPKAPKSTVSVAFEARAGDDRVACGTPIAGLGSTGAAAQLADLRFYVSGARLTRRGGGSVPISLKTSKNRLTSGGDAVTLIDLANGVGACAKSDGAVSRTVLGSVPKGRYTGLRFDVGVPFALNHGDVTTAPAPLNLPSMAWSWQAGRKFTNIELQDPAGAEGTWAAKSFMVHVGSTGCEGDPASGETVRCRAANRIRVTLKRFDPKRQHVALDLRALLAGVDVTQNAGGGPGCMAGPTDPECGPVMGALGLDWRADGSGSGTMLPGARGVFRAVPR